MVKKLLFALAALCMSVQLFAQGGIKNILHRFEDPDKGNVVFIEKGTRTLGISGSYRSFDASGLANGDGYSILSMLNIGSGAFRTWVVAPSFSYFPSDDFSLGVRLEYTGYQLNSDLRLDLRDVLGGIFDDGTEEGQEAMTDLNIPISSRHMHHHKGGVALTARRYLSFFGSRLFAVFGEGRLYGSYGVTTSHPLKENTDKIRNTSMLDIGLKFAVGGALKLRDGSSFALSIPLLGITWDHTIQNKAWINGNNNNAKMNSFRIARNIDFVGLQFSYFRCISPKKQK